MNRNSAIQNGKISLACAVVLMLALGMVQTVLGSEGDDGNVVREEEVLIPHNTFLGKNYKVVSFKVDPGDYLVHLESYGNATLNLCVETKVFNGYKAKSSKTPVETGNGEVSIRISPDKRCAVYIYMDTKNKGGVKGKLTVTEE
jgi:hypothetical protein